MKLLTVVGARPQLIKASALSHELRGRHEEVLVHTGQHYDHNMSQVFFQELGIPNPAHHLGVGGGTHGRQTGEMLSRLEAVLMAETPDAMIVYGDTNSTLAGALAAAKLQVPVAHVEAGLRSFDRGMPEEVNRVVADHVATWLFAPSRTAAEQLAAEGLTAGVHVVGDIMADVLRWYATGDGHSPVAAATGLEPGDYYLATVHRAANTDDPARLAAILDALGSLDRPVLLPLHPRTRDRVERFGIVPGGSVRVIAPVGYLDLIALLSSCAAVLTDSGGMQKEAYWLRVPCITLRDETEWVETVRTGWNVLCGAEARRIRAAVANPPGGERPHPDLYGDGRAAARIVAVLEGRPCEC